ncbi:YhgE/Pip domain-containing protein [uncultured Microbacterium sp.]|uniref:YhgE/Pip domain-containing protein n=1 Tax=uncultured Microbacterium sp. TaxID=191216 RepID=UPI00261D2F7A|nr:YhgE/Pip domain-containing protein [uncultured Microbacterium sp.]
MRNVWRVLKRDVKRLVRVPLALVIIGGALITPSLYAWFNITAFWNPFDNTKDLSIAVVNLDEGASNSLVGEINVGDQLVAKLKDNDDLGWHFLSEEAAMDSVHSGESFAAFVVPATFSADLLSITTGDFTQPKLLYYVNEKENGVAPEITDTGATTLQTQVTDAFTQQVAETVATAIREGGEVAEEDLAAAESQVISDLQAVSAVIAQTRGTLGALEGKISDARAGLQRSEGVFGEIDVVLGDAQTTLTDVNALAASAQSELLRLAGEATTGYVIGSAEVGQAASGALEAVGRVSAASSAILAAVQAQQAILGQSAVLIQGLDQQLAQTATALGSLDESLAAVEGDMSVAISDLQTLGGVALFQDLEALTNLDPEQIAAFLATPVKVDQHTIFPTPAYGSLMGALFINLSLWIGAFVLVVILRLDVDEDEIPDLTERQKYMGRWSLFACIAVLQAIVLSIGNLMIGVQHVNVFAFTVTPILIGLAYLSVIYALSVTFGYVGKGLAVVLVIMQIPGASGIYPIQLMPEFFQSLYPFFPFTYGIDAMREVISGFAGMAYWRYMGMLAVFAALAFFLGLVLRRHFANVTRLFTTQVRDTELFTSEDGAPTGRGYRVNHVLRALADRARYNERLEKRARPFARSYRSIRNGIVAVGIAGMLILAALSMLVPSAKIEFVGLWILWLILVFIALVALEYIRYTLRLSAEVGDMPEERLREELAELESKR